MKVVHEETIQSLNAAASIVRQGGVVIVPTETFYALAADPFQNDAVRRIFTSKSRSPTKPLPLIAASVDDVKGMVAPLQRTAYILMDRFWPGSVTILFRPARPLAELVTGPDGKIGVRVPTPCPALRLAQRVGGFITATSANVSGDPDPDMVERIAPEVRNAVDLIMDLGPAPGGKPSTVIEPLDSGEVRILREGAVPGVDIRQFLASLPRGNRLDKPLLTR